MPGDVKSGDGRVDVRVLANTRPARSAAVVVAGQSVTIEQRAALICSVSLTPELVQRSSVGRSGFRVGELSGRVLLGSHGRYRIG